MKGNVGNRKSEKLAPLKSSQKFSKSRAKIVQPKCNPSAVKLNPMRTPTFCEALRQEECFRYQVKAIEQLLRKEATADAGKKLDALVGQVEKNHYTKREMRQSHVQELYRLTEALNLAEDVLSIKEDTNRRKGNGTISNIVDALNKNMFADALKYIETGIGQYKKADDLRWESLEALKVKVEGDKLAVKASTEYNLGNVESAISLSKLAHQWYRKYKLSNQSQNCQLLLSLGSSTVNWNYDSYRAAGEVDVLRYKQCENPLAYFSKLVNSDASTILKEVHSLIGQKAYALAKEKILVFENFLKWLKQGPPDILAVYQRQIYVSELKGIVASLTDPALPEYTWHQYVSLICEELVDINAAECMQTCGVFKSLGDCILNQSRTSLKECQLYLRIVERALTLNFSRVKLGQMRLLPALLLIIKSSNSVNTRNWAIKIVLIFADCKQLVFMALRENAVSTICSSRLSYVSDRPHIMIVAKALRHCVVSAAATEMIIAQGGVSTMIAMIRRTPKQEDLVQIAFQFFLNSLKFKEFYLSLVNSDFVPAFFGALRENLKCRKVRTLSYDIMQFILPHEDIRIVLVREGIKLLLKKILPHITERNAGERDTIVIIEQTLTTFLTPNSTKESTNIGKQTQRRTDAGLPLRTQRPRSTPASCSKGGQVCKALDITRCNTSEGQRIRHVSNTDCALPLPSLGHLALQGSCENRMAKNCLSHRRKQLQLAKHFVNDMIDEAIEHSLKMTQIVNDSKNFNFESFIHHTAEELIGIALSHVSKQ